MEKNIVRSLKSIISSFGCIAITSTISSMHNKGLIQYISQRRDIFF